MTEQELAKLEVLLETFVEHMDVSIYESQGVDAQEDTCLRLCIKALAGHEDRVKEFLS